MYMTDVQKSTIALLKAYRCLQERQIVQLMEMQYSYGEDNIKNQIERLVARTSHLIYHPEPSMLGMHNAEPDDELLTSMDVMLAFRAQGITAYEPGKHPFKLTFFKHNDKGHLRAYYIVAIHRSDVLEIAQQASIAYRGKGNAVIFALDDMEQSSVIRFPYEHYYTVIEDGRRLFFKGVTDTD